MITPLFIRGFINVTIPAVYSDALTYEEQIGVLMAKINEVIKEFNGMTSEEIETVIREYLTPEKIQELLNGSFGDAIDAAITANNANYYDKAATDSEIDGAISTEVTDRNAAIAIETARASGAELAINNNLSNNYYTKAETDAAIAEHEPSLQGYATIQDAIDIDAASMALEVTARNNAINQAITANNLNYYNKTQIDTQRNTMTGYVDSSVGAITGQVDAKLNAMNWLPFSVEQADWNTTYNNVAAKYSSYNSAVTSDISKMYLEVRLNDDSTSGAFRLHGQLIPVSSASIHAGDTCGFMYIPFAINVGSETDLKLFAHIEDTSTGTVLHVPLALVPTSSGDTIVVYKAVNTNVTPDFSASNKRIYIDVSGVFDSSSLY